MRRGAAPALVAAAALLAAVVAPGVAAAPGRIGLALSVAGDELRRELPEAGLAAALRNLAADGWPALFALIEDGGGDATARVTVARAGTGFAVTTGLTTPAGSSRTLRSTVPAGSPGAVAAAAAADIAWLWAAARGFGGLEPGPGPGLAAVLETDLLAGMTGWSPVDLEPLAVTASAEGLTVLFPRGWITFAPQFRLGPAAARDLALPAPPGVPGGIARGARGAFVVERTDGGLVIVDPLLATPGTVKAPGGARLVGATGNEAVVAAATLITRVPLGAGGAAPRSLTIAAGWITALALDAGGRVWAWDGQERRVRVLDADGRETHSLRPLVPAAALPAPQAIAPLPDGSFLLGGAGELWKFEASGIPSWRIARLPGVPGGALPAAFALAVDPASGVVWLLDGPSRRVLQFGMAEHALDGRPSDDAARALAAELAVLDERDAAALARAGELALAADQPLAAARFAVRLARRGAPGADDLAAAAEVLLLGDRARAAAGAVDALAGALLAARSADACQAAVELARAWRDRDPGDADAGRLLERLLALRRELRDAAAAKDDTPSVTASAAAAPGGGGRLARLRILVRAAGTPLAGLRLACSLPGWTPVPASVEVGDLAPGEERVVETDLALDGAHGDLPTLVTGAAWLHWQRGAEERAAAVTMDVTVTDGEGVSR